LEQLRPGNLAKALLWGLVLATISALWWTPALFPEFHAGFFSSNLGWKTVVGIYLWHVIWAVHVALIYNPLPAEELGGRVLDARRRGRHPLQPGASLTSDGIR